MKKIYISFLVLLGCIGVARAQKRNATEFGIDVGYNGSYVIEGQSINHTDIVSGFNVGLSADHYFSNTWSLKAKVIYDQKGWGNGFLTLASGNSIYGLNYKLNYLTVPVMANWHFARYRNWYLNFGPYIGFLLDAKESSNTANVKDFFNNVDGGLALGIGVKLPISKTTKFFIEYQAQSGVVNIFKQSNSSIQNATGDLNIGLNF